MRGWGRWSAHRSDTPKARGSIPRPRPRPGPIGYPARPPPSQGGNRGSTPRGATHTFGPWCSTASTPASGAGGGGSNLSAPTLISRADARRLSGTPRFDPSTRASTPSSGSGMHPMTARSDTAHARADASRLSPQKRSIPVRTTRPRTPHGSERRIVMSYLTRFTTRSTPQRERLRPDQTVNSEGAFVWQVDRWTRLRRFLILGSEGGSFYAGERDLTRENTAALDEGIAEDRARHVARSLAD